MKRTLRWRQLLPLLLVVAVTVPFIPLIPGRGLYEGVGPANGKSLSGSGRAKYIFDGRELYLIRQQTGQALILVTWVKVTVWTAEDMARLRRNHPELDKEEIWN